MSFSSAQGRFIGASLAALAVASVAAPAAAQQATVAGRVTDEQGNGLPGARVTIVETGLGARTNRQGEFSIPGVPQGQVTVEVDYLGLPTTSQAVSVGAAGRTSVSIVVRSSAVRDEIVVRGSISSQSARALNQQRTNPNTSNVVSADTIGRFPDPNVAEALQRVPGFGIERDQGEGRRINLRGAPSEFTAITIDGISITSPNPGSRAIDLDTVPSDVVGAIEVSKTLLPQLDADSIAGAVNLVTRSPFDKTGFRFNGQGGASYNGFGGTKDRRASGVISNTFGGDRFGVLVSGSYSRTNRQVDNIESEWDVVTRPEGDDILAVVEQEYKDYDTRRQRLAFTGAFEFRPDDISTYFVRGNYSKFRDDEDRNLLAILYEDGTLAPGATEQTATWNNTRFAKEFRNRIVQNEILSISAGGIHAQEGFTIDYTGSYTESEQTFPRRAQLLYRSAGANGRPSIGYDYSANPDEPAVSLFTTNEHLNPANYAFRENTFRSQDTFDTEWSGAVNAEIYTSGAATYKIGTKVRIRSVESDNEQFRDRTAGAAPAAGLAGLLDGRPSQNFGYVLGEKMDPALVGAYFDARQPASTASAFRRIPQSISSDYQASEDIIAGYGMSTIEAGPTTFIFGLRIEHTNLSGSATRFDADTGAISQELASNRYTNFFPNATLRYEFTDNLIGRAAVTRAISRPNYLDVVPRIVQADEGAGRIAATLGNPELEPALSNNFDVGIEYYMPPLGLLSLSGFYKDISNYQFELTRNGVFGGSPATLTQPFNAPDGYILGFEANWTQQFTFLPGPLSGFGVFANYTFTDSEMDIGDPVAGRNILPLPGQSKHAYNLALFYEVERFNVRLSYNKRSDYLQELNANDPRLDVIWEGREQLDLASSFDLTPNFQVFVEAKNLTNTKGVRYAGVRERPIEVEQFGFNVFSGLRINF